MLAALSASLWPEYGRIAAAGLQKPPWRRAFFMDEFHKNYLQRFERMGQRYESTSKMERPLSGMSLEALLQEYTLNPDRTGAVPRRAKKLCAPCCHLMAPHRAKYCDAVSVPGEMYCAAHLQPAMPMQRQAKFPFSLLPAFRTVPWRSREWA
jgi:hypothetical protein